MKKQLLFLTLALIFSFRMNAQTESTGDFPGTGNGPVFTLSNGTNTFSGTITTPTDGQDRFQINLNTGQTITAITAGITSNGAQAPNGFFSVNTVSKNFPGGSFSSFPTTPGTYPVLVGANFSEGEDWTITVNVTGGTPSITPSTNNILYVNKNVSGGSQSGNSWTNALPELQEALQWANTNWNGSNGTLQIWVAAGLYYPTDDSTDRNASFQMVNNVEIYGGFAGTEPSSYDLSLRDFTANTSILSGDIDANDTETVITDPTTQVQGANSYSVVNASNTNGTAILDGVTITAGNADGASNDASAAGSGGGLYMNLCSSVFAHITVSGNQANIYGGGVFINGNSAPKMDYTTVSYNKGSGIHNNGILTMTNSKIFENTANFYGGGIYNQGNLSLLNTCVFDNTANHSGGGIYNTFTTLNLTNVTITGNTAKYDGGGIYNSLEITATLSNSIIWSNTAGDIENEISNFSTSGLYIALNLNYCLFPDGADAIYNDDSFGGTITVNENNNLHSAPKFTDPTNGDYSLKATSPAVNAGDNQAYANVGGNLQNDVDLAGNPRVFGSTIDMGAYEAQNTPPTANCQSITVNLDQNGNASITAADIDNGSSDAEGGVTLSIDVSSFDCSNLGDNAVVLTAKDDAGVTATCSATVTVKDDLGPVPDVANLPDITMECGVTTADIPTPTATDNCTGQITATTSDPLDYSAQGTYTITWNYDDGHGNTTSQTQTVIVNDQTAPVPNVANLPDITSECAVSAADIPTPTATDNCTGEVTATTGDPLDYSAQGNYTITWNYADGNGNTTSQTQTVIVNDQSAPIPDVANLPDIEMECGVTAEDIPTPTATDNCTGEVTATTSDPLDYSAQGTYTITWNYADGNGNTSSQMQSVIVQPSSLEQVTFNDQTVTYDSNLHTIDVANLPTGASVSYSISPSTETPNGATKAGTYVVTAELTPPVSAVNCSPVALTATLTIEKAQQVITFDPIPVKHLEDDPDFQLMATASSGLPVSYTYSYSATNPPATVSSNGFVTLQTSGQLTITAHQDGNSNYLPANPVEQPLQINSRDASIHKMTIAGQGYDTPGKKVRYTISCGASADEVDVNIETETNATVVPSHDFSITTPKPGIYTQDVTVTSQDGSAVKTYTLTIERKFPLFAIAVNKFDNVLLINNNPQTNGGYQFVAYQWFKNGKLISNGQYFSAGDRPEDRLDPNALYSAALTTKDGKVLHTCATGITLKNSYKVSLSPNPVKIGNSIMVYADFPKEERQAMHITIHTLTGAIYKNIRSTQKKTKIQLPASIQSGIYLLTCSTGKHRKTFKFIVK